VPVRFEVYHRIFVIWSIIAAMKILIIKTSSLGDVVHMLPALTDAVAALPGLRADWVVEEGFAAIPRLHPAVDRVIPVAIRRWRRALGRAATWREMAAFRRALQAESYDLVLDSQCLLKSALLAVQARGPRAGLDAASAREPLASHFYGQRYAAARDLHAISRNRVLTAQALGYALKVDAPVHYGVSVVAAESASEVVCLHGTARVEKEYPEGDWAVLAQQLVAAGLTPVFPAGNAREAARAARLVAACPGARRLATMPLAELMPLIGGARAVVGVDTGLMHLAAAFGRPGIGLYPATDPIRFGAVAEAGAPILLNVSNRVDLEPKRVAAGLFKLLGVTT
jgi:heptosyltransferase-1